MLETAQATGEIRQELNRKRRGRCRRFHAIPNAFSLGFITATVAQSQQVASESHEGKPQRKP